MDNNLDFSEDPKDYYFWFEDNEYMTGQREFSITPKSWYDIENCLIDNALGIEDLLYDNGIMNISDSSFIYLNGSDKEGRELLLKLGITEKQMHW